MQCSFMNLSWLDSTWVDFTRLDSTRLLSIYLNHSFDISWNTIVFRSQMWTAFIQDESNPYAPSQTIAVEREIWETASHNCGAHQRSHAKAKMMHFIENFRGQRFDAVSRNKWINCAKNQMKEWISSGRAIRSINFTEAKNGILILATRSAWMNICVPCH